MATGGELQTLIDRCRRDHHSWINGDASAYELPEDGSVMGAVGGVGLGGADTTARQGAVARQWRSGRGDVEFVNGAIEGDVAWLALIERAIVSFENDPEGVERRWDLRVTEVFRRVGTDWERLHRHADPLVDRVPLATAAALCSGHD